MQESERRDSINIVLVMFVISLISYLAVATFQVNANDTDIFIEGAEQFFRGELEYIPAGTLPYFTYMSPPHLPILIYPFIAFGEHWSAYWDVFFILVLLAGDMRYLGQSLVRLIFVVAPPVLFVMGAANITGTATGIGLLLLFLVERGYVRGLAWAFLLVRPQDSLLLLVYDGVLALLDRDWKPFVVCGGILLIPVLVYSPLIYFDWLSATGSSSLNLGLLLTHGPLVAFGYLLAVYGARLFGWRDGHIYRRTWQETSKLERYWLLIVTLMILGPYTVVYMLWLLLLPVREMGIARTLLFFAVVFTVGVYSMRFPNDVSIQIGMTIIGFTGALLLPRVSVTRVQATV